MATIEFTNLAARLAGAVEDSELDNEQRILIARTIVDVVLANLKQNVDPVACKAEGMLHVASTALRDACDLLP